MHSPSLILSLDKTTPTGLLSGGLPCVGRVKVWLSVPSLISSPWSSLESAGARWSPLESMLQLGLERRRGGRAVGVPRAAGVRVRERQLLAAQWEREGQRGVDTDTSAMKGYLRPISYMQHVC